jgi:hypothetical protein
MRQVDIHPHVGLHHRNCSAEQIGRESGGVLAARRQLPATRVARAFPSVSCCRQGNFV